MDEGLPKIDASLDKDMTPAFLWRKVWQRSRWLIFLMMLAEAGITVLVFRGINAAFLMIPVFIIFVAYGNERRRQETAYLESFAALNGYTYAPSAPTESVVATIFTYGEEPRSIRNVISGAFTGDPFRMFEWSYYVGSGKSRHQVTVLIFEVAFPADVPHLILDENTASYSSMEKISLEGDFNKLFALHAQKGSEIEALEIFSPNFMSFLIDDFKSSGLLSFRKKFELCGRKLYLWLPDGIGKSADILSAF
jgi:hypothetical protein